MASTEIDFSTADRALEILDELVERQRRTVLQCARRLRPELTEEDLRNVQAFPDVCSDPRYQYEDGQLAGYVAARIALRAQLIGGTLKQS
jgi:hypothetical protein